MRVDTASYPFPLRQLLGSFQGTWSVDPAPEEEIKEILDLQQASGQPCGRVLELLDTHIAGIDHTIRALQQLRATLVHARDTAKASSRRGDQAVVCRLIESQPSPRPTATA